MRIVSIFILVSMFLFSGDGNNIKINHKNKLYIIGINRKVYLDNIEINKIDNTIYDDISNENIKCSTEENIFSKQYSIEIITNEKIKFLDSNIGIFNENNSEEIIITGRKTNLQTIIFIDECWYYLDEFEKINGYERRKELENFLNSL